MLAVFYCIGVPFFFLLCIAIRYATGKSLGYEYIYILDGSNVTLAVIATNQCSMYLNDVHVACHMHMQECIRSYSVVCFDRQFAVIIFQRQLLDQWTAVREWQSGVLLMAFDVNYHLYPTHGLCTIIMYCYNYNNSVIIILQKYSIESDLKKTWI